MKKEGSKKIQIWSKKDMATNVVVYLINVILLFGMFVGALELNGKIGVLTAENVSNVLTYFIIIAIASTIMWLFFFFDNRDFLRSAVNSEMLFLALEISLAVSYAIGKYVNVYLRPLALPALLILFLKSRRSAVFMDMVFCVLMMLMDLLPGSGVYGIKVYVLFMIGAASCILSLFLMSGQYSRFKMLLKGFFISIPATLFVLVGFSDGNLDGAWQNILSAIFSGTVGVGLFMLLLPVFESFFKKITIFKLAELTDHKAKLIKKMIKEAPGTFNHAIVVSNIAEACATAIEEDAILARTCAYYHDVGKLRRPQFFSENQPDGFNPHDDLTPELSTNIIKAHPQDGYQLLLKHRMPVEIANVCLEHHGTMPILYFYDKAKKFTDGEVDIKPYCYLGPKPQSKISAIIMIADGCEAATRTLKDRSPENVKKVVRKIVNDRMELGQFDECEITLKELNIIIHTIVNNLTGVYHSRVEYPKLSLEGLKEKAEESEVKD